jgi:hypothetical protein
LEDLVTKINQAGARVILCTPSVIGERHDGSNELDKMLEEYAGISREVARKTGAFLVDLRKLFLHDLMIRNAENQKQGILTTDGVHLNPAGNEFVKDCLVRPVVAGTDISPENLAEGLTHCFTLSFADAAARDAYIIHPAHQEFVKEALPLIQRAVVVDYLSH